MEKKKEKKERKKKEKMLASSLRRAVLVSVRSNASVSSSSLRWSSNDVKFDGEGRVVGRQYDVGVPDLEHTEFLIPSPGLFFVFCLFPSFVFFLFLIFFLFFRKPWFSSWYVPPQERL